MHKHDERVPTLDGLRGLAILLVLIHHGLYFRPTTTSEAVFQRASGGWDSWGWIGVDLFFVLSGYLITNILLSTRGQAGYFTCFYARRTLRIFPLYFLSLAIVFLVLPRLLGDIARVPAADQPWFWTYTMNFRYGLGLRMPTWMSHFWSLCVEEHFYLFWPLVVLLAGRRLTQVCIAVVVGTAALRIGLHLAGVKTLALYCMTATRIDALALGGLIASLGQAPGGLTRFVPACRRLAPALAAVLVGLAFFSDGLNPLHPVVVLFGLSTAALFWGAALILIVAGEPKAFLGRFFSRPWLVWLGTYSYGLYVFHMPILGYIHEALRTEDAAIYGDRLLPVVAGSQIPFVLVQAAAMISASAAVAFVCFHVYEKPFLALKRHFAPKSPSVRANRGLPIDEGLRAAS